MRSKHGRQFLEGIRAHLESHRITRVTFHATEDGISTTLHLDNNDDYTFQEDKLSTPTLQEQFSSHFRKRTYAKKPKRTQRKET